MLERGSASSARFQLPLSQEISERPAAFGDFTDEMNIKEYQGILII